MIFMYSSTPQGWMRGGGSRQMPCLGYQCKEAPMSSSGQFIHYESVSALGSKRTRTCFLSTG